MTRKMLPRCRIAWWTKPILGVLGSMAVWDIAPAHAVKPAKAPEATPKPASGISIPYRTERPGVVSINVYDKDGVMVRRLVRAERMAGGPHSVSWDRLGEDGKPVAEGEYTWRGIIHDGIGLKLRGWAGNSGATPWSTADGKGDWGGDTGVPSAVAADAQKVYLGWSLAERGKSIVACDLEGRVQWSHRRAEGASGCQALGVDGGVVFVLGGLAGTGAEGGCVYRLNAKDGKPLPWPNGKLDLKLASFWPENASTKPEIADAMSVRHDRIYLTFTKSEFMTVLDAKTGAYLQTVVGLPPGKIDVAPTKTNLPDAPDKVVDADFALIEVGNGLLGKVLFAHDPLWVVTSAAVPMNTPLPITALNIIGDAGKFHRHHAFIGLGAPYHVVQARSLIDTDDLLWMAGKSGGRPETGPWQPNSLRDIRGVALAGDGNLWVAEGGGFPKRFSVWDTTGQEGKLVKDFFGPMGNDGGGAINPLDPDLMFAQGCEWRLDRKTGKVTCLGIVTTLASRRARYAVGENGNAYLVIGIESGVETGIEIFERIGDGDYKRRASVYSGHTSPLGIDSADRTIFVWADENGDGVVQQEEHKSVEGWLTVSPNRVLQDMTLCCSMDVEGRRTHVLKVQSWSPCGAPRYDLSKALELSGGRGLSADGKSALMVEGKDGLSASISQIELSSGRKRWTLANVDASAGERGSSAYLPAPAGNIWLLSRPLSSGNETFLINEDGFELGTIFAADEKSARWPKSSAPSADLTNAFAKSVGSLTQAADGKIYLPAGESAAWNLELTGLDTATALPGSTVTVEAPPAK